MPAGTRALRLVAFGFEPVDEGGEVVEGAEAFLERFGGDGAGVEVAYEGGAVKLADESLEGDVDADELVIIVLDGVRESDADTEDVRFLFAFQLHEIHLLGLEMVFVESNLEVSALGLLEGDELPPVEVGGRGMSAVYCNFLKMVLVVEMNFQEGNAII